MERAKTIIEAIIFASGKGIEKKALREKFPDVTTKEFNGIIEELKMDYPRMDSRGIIFVDYGDSYAFTTNPTYGEIVAQALTKEREKELTEKVLEVLSIIAYRQPITRAEIEKIRNSGCDYALEVLMNHNLVTVIGRKQDALGNPYLYGTTQEFLVKFELASLSDLPSMKAIQERINLIDDNIQRQKLLFKEVEIPEENEGEGAPKTAEEDTTEDCVSESEDKQESELYSEAAAEQVEATDSELYSDDNNGGTDE